jgi:hypothetical protein
VFVQKIKAQVKGKGEETISDGGTIEANEQKKK